MVVRERFVNSELHLNMPLTTYIEQIPYSIFTTHKLTESGGCGSVRDGKGKLNIMVQYLKILKKRHRWMMSLIFSIWAQSSQYPQQCRCPKENFVIHIKTRLLGSQLSTFKNTFESAIVVTHQQRHRQVAGKSVYNSSCQFASNPSSALDL
jgi:hypothetical protein